MIPAPFDYVRATSLAHALQLRAADLDAVILAGGHSLIPMMKLRLAAPENVIDISELAELRYIRREADTICIGAATTYDDILRSDLVHQTVRLLPQVVRHIGDPQVRYRGTIGGALSHGDPAADLPTALAALDAQLVLTSGCGQRVVSLEQFVINFFTTDLSDDELLTEIRIPATYGENVSYQRFSASNGGWAIVAVAVAGTRIALAGMGPTVLRAHAAEDVLASGGGPAEAAELADHGMAPLSDRHADADYRRHLARVLTFRTLQAAVRHH